VSRNKENRDSIGNKRMRPAGMAYNFIILALNKKR